MPTPPSIDNYAIPTGKLYFTDDDNPTLGSTDLGNCVTFTVSSTVTTKDHFRNYGGQRTKDKTILSQVASDIKFTLDEITKYSVSLFALGTISGTATDGSIIIDALTRTQFKGILHVVGDNDVGPRITWKGRVSFQPSGDFSLIQDNDNWQQVNIAASIEEDDTLGFGKWTVTA
jgi:hypothetical protein